MLGVNANHDAGIWGFYSAVDEENDSDDEGM